EVTPHHFAITDKELSSYDSNYKMKPPLRRQHDVEAIIEGICNGTVDAIATDHAPHPGDEKMQEFERCPFGITGLETAIGLSLSELVHPGHIAVGAPGDVTVFDLETEWTFDVSQSLSKSRNTPFSGRRFKGGPVATVVGG